MGFKRREQALVDLGDMFGNLTACWGAAHTWKVKTKDERWVRVIELFDGTSAKLVMKLFMPP